MEKIDEEGEAETCSVSHCLLVDGLERARV